MIMSALSLSVICLYVLSIHVHNLVHDWFNTWVDQTCNNKWTWMDKTTHKLTFYVFVHVRSRIIFQKNPDSFSFLSGLIGQRWMRSCRLPPHHRRLPNFQMWNSNPVLLWTTMRPTWTWKRSRCPWMSPVCHLRTRALLGDGTKTNLLPRNELSCASSMTLVLLTPSSPVSILKWTKW